MLSPNSGFPLVTSPTTIGGPSTVPRGMRFGPGGGVTSPIGAMAAASNSYGARAGALSGSDNTVTSSSAGAASSSTAVGGTSSVIIQPMGVFRHIPHSAAVDHAVVTSFGFSQCGLHGVSASRDRALRLYDVGTVMLRDSFALPQSGCEKAIFTHSSDVVAFTPSHTTDAPIYLLSLSTGRVLAGISDMVAGGGSKSGSEGVSAMTPSGALAAAFPTALAFQPQQSAFDNAAKASADSPSSPTSPSSPRPLRPPTLFTMPTAASTSLALHPSSDMMLSARKDGWAQLVVPTVGRPLALLKPNEADEAFARRRRARMAACIPFAADGGRGGGSTAPTAPTTSSSDEAANAGSTSSSSVDDDTASAPFNFEGYYGSAQLVGGGQQGRALNTTNNNTVWFEHDGDHHTTTASFSPCGAYAAVSRSTTVSLYDLRNLSGGPTRVIASSQLFAYRGRFEHDPPQGDKDTPIIASVQLGGGGLLLATNTLGHSTLVDAHRVYSSECDFNGGMRVLYHYNGGGYPTQYFSTGNEELVSAQQQQQQQNGGVGGVPAADWGFPARGGGAYPSHHVMHTTFAYPAPRSCGAIFTSPSEGCRSMVVQPATRRAHTAAAPYPILVYEAVGDDGCGASVSGRSNVGGSSSAKLKAAGNGAAAAVMTHQLLPRDAGPTRVMAANPRYGIIASAANTLQWWSVGDVSTSATMGGDEW